MRIFSMRVALVLLLLSPWRPVKPEAATSCTCALEKACSCEVGQTVTLDSGQASVKVTWKKDGADIATGRATYEDGTQSSQKATMINLAKEDSGLYTASWVESNTPTTKSFTVAVAPVICTAYQVCAVTKGHSFKLPSGISSGTGKWAKESTAVDAKKFAETGQHDLISQADSLAAGMYVAIHDDNVAKMTAFLVEVHDPVTVSVERVAENQVSLSCIASGSFKALKWKKGDTAITAGRDYKLGLNNAQLIIKDGSANPGKYTCVAVQFDGSEKESPALHLSSVTDGDVLLSNPGGKPSGGAGAGGKTQSASVAPSYSCALLALCVLLLQLYWMV